MKTLMVVHQVLALATCFGLQQQPLTEAEGLEFARRFANRAQLGIGDEVHGNRDALTLRGTERSDSGRVYFDLGIPRVGVDLRQRNIYGYSDSLSSLAGEWDLNRAVPPARQVELATELYRLAGHTGQLSLYERYAEKWSGDTPEFWLRFLRTYNGVPCLDHWVEFRFEHITGRLSHFSANYEPLPLSPPSLTPVCSLASARAAIIARVFARFRHFSELYDGRGVRLGIWKPELEPGIYHFLDLTAEQIQMASQNRGILVYWGSFWDRPDETAPRGSSFWAWVDARTGRILAARDNPEGGGFGKSGDSKPKAFLWSLGPQKIVFSAGTKVVTVDRGLISEARAPRRNEQGRPVVVQVGRLYLSARFMPTSGLLVADRGGARTYGNPNPALLMALRKICP